MNKQLSYR